VCGDSLEYLVKIPVHIRDTRMRDWSGCGRKSRLSPVERYERNALGRERAVSPADKVHIVSFGLLERLLITRLHNDKLQRLTKGARILARPKS
jgi:hypothetical protein